jgi:hypothetical protein
MAGLPNFSGLNNMFQMNSPINGILSPEGITEAGALQLVFRNLEKVFSDKSYTGIIEKCMQSPFSMLKGINVSGVMPTFGQILPSIFDKGAGRSK